MPHITGELEVIHRSAEVKHDVIADCPADDHEVFFRHHREQLIDRGSVELAVHAFAIFGQGCGDLRAEDFHTF